MYAGYVIDFGLILDALWDHFWSKFTSDGALRWRSERELASSATMAVANDVHIRKIGFRVDFWWKVVFNGALRWRSERELASSATMAAADDVRADVQAGKMKLQGGPRKSKNQVALHMPRAARCARRFKKRS